MVREGCTCNFTISCAAGTESPYNSSSAVVIGGNAGNLSIRSLGSCHSSSGSKVKMVGDEWGTVIRCNCFSKTVTFGLLGMKERKRKWTTTSIVYIGTTRRIHSFIPS